MKENIKTWPEIIYLQHGCDDPPAYEEVYKDLEEITWCQSNVEEGDIMYIRADVHEQRIAELTSQIAHMQSDCSEAQYAAEAAQAEIARLIRDAEYLSIEKGQLKELVGSLTAKIERLADPGKLHCRNGSISLGCEREVIDLFVTNAIKRYKGES